MHSDTIKTTEFRRFTLKQYSFGTAFTAAALSALLLTACGGGGSGSGNGSGDGNNETEVTREHDSRTFIPAADISFAAKDKASAFYGIYDGIQGPAVYSAEIPDVWNGGLIMYTHGYRGDGPELEVSLPDDAWRMTVLAAGYAWAASSYSANY